MPTPRHAKTRAAHDRNWPCPCGAKNSYRVVRVERDEDGRKLRIRRCGNCQTVMATEEVLFPVEAFYYRAASKQQREEVVRRHLASTRRKSEMAKCKRCGALYNIGRYSAHAIKPVHLATIKQAVTPRRRLKHREYARNAYWRKRGVNLDQANMAFALGDLGGEDRRVTRVIDMREDAA